MGAKRALPAAALVLFSLWWMTEAEAETGVNETRAAAADGVVAIEAPRGTIAVEGWAKDEVQVTGTVNPTGTQVRLSGDPRGIRLVVGPPAGAEAKLDLRVPRGAAVRVEGRMTTVRVSGVKGAVTVQSINGDVVVDDAQEVEVQNVNGNVDLTGAGRRAKVQSVSGTVKVKGGAGDLSVSSVKGPISVTGDGFDRIRMATVDGRAEFDGRLGARASLSAESVSGVVRLTLSKTDGTDFSLTTLRGKIENGLGAGAQASAGPRPGQRLSFSVGGGGARVTVQTFSGDVILVAK